MQCHHFDEATCRSCSLMGVPYRQQISDKVNHCQALLAEWPTMEWLPPVESAESGFRNKAKMVVSGTSEAPVLGILDRDGLGVDLADCGLYPPEFTVIFHALRSFITTARIAPYEIDTRRGELKFLLVTMAPSGDLMVRFVLRSQEPITRIRKHLHALQASLPRLAVISANIQPEHKAVIEGPNEIALTTAETLTMQVNDIPLALRSRSFFQTNTAVAAALYRQAQAWVMAVQPATVWDLYCGVGGFALHCAVARPEDNSRVVGVEFSEEAVVSAKETAKSLGLRNAHFFAADATEYAVGHTESPLSPAPDLVIVNPPRRGIGSELARWLEHSSARHVIYSSCNAVTLAKDLTAMPSYRPVTARVLDMFPQTHHYEVIVLLERAAA